MNRGPLAVYETSASSFLTYSDVERHVGRLCIVNLLTKIINLVSILEYKNDSTSHQARIRNNIHIQFTQSSLLRLSVTSIQCFLLLSFLNNYTVKIDNMPQESTGRRKTSKPVSKSTTNPTKPPPRNNKKPDFLEYHDVNGEHNLDHPVTKQKYFESKDRAVRQAHEPRGHSSDSRDRERFSASKNTLEESRAKEKEERENNGSSTLPSSYYKDDRDPNMRESVQGIFGLPEDNWGKLRRSGRHHNSSGTDGTSSHRTRG